MAATGHVEQPGGAAAIGIRTPLRKKSVFDAGRVRMMFSLSKRIEDRVRAKFGEDSSHSLYVISPARKKPAKAIHKAALMLIPS